MHAACRFLKYSNCPKCYGTSVGCCTLCTAKEKGYCKAAWPIGAVAFGQPTFSIEKREMEKGQPSWAQPRNSVEAVAMASQLLQHAEFHE